MENEIKQLLKSTDREDIKLGIILAIKELGIEWCKREFINESTTIYKCPPMTAHRFFIVVFPNEEFIILGAIIAYTDRNNPHYKSRKKHFSTSEIYEYTDYTD